MYGNGSNIGAARPAASLSTFWAQCLEQSDRQAQMLLEVMQVAGDPRRVHQRWQEALAQVSENFFRSPAFLEVMRRHLQAVSALKGLQDQIIGGTARLLGLPLADDITGLFERLSGTERTIVDRLRAIEDRLKAVEATPRNTPDQCPTS